MYRRRQLSDGFLSVPSNTNTIFCTKSARYAARDAAAVLTFLVTGSGLPEQRQPKSYNTSPRDITGDVNQVLAPDVQPQFIQTRTDPVALTLFNSAIATAVRHGLRYMSQNTNLRRQLIVARRLCALGHLVHGILHLNTLRRVQHHQAYQHQRQEFRPNHSTIGALLEHSSARGHAEIDRCLRTP